MITQQEVDRVKGDLLTLLDEDTHNEERILQRLSQIRSEKGIHVHSALLLILTHLMLDEEEARAHWNAILKHRIDLITRLGRDVGLRVARSQHGQLQSLGEDRCLGTLARSGRTEQDEDPHDASVGAPASERGWAAPIGDLTG